MNSEIKKAEKLKGDADRKAIAQLRQMASQTKNISAQLWFADQISQIKNSRPISNNWS